MASELRCNVCGRTFPYENTGSPTTRCPFCQMTVPVGASSSVGSGGTGSGYGQPSFGPSGLGQSAAADQWYVYAFDGQRYGPITKGDLERWVSENRLTPQCQVFQQGWANWKFASEVFPHLQTKAAAGAPGAAVSANPYAAPTFTGIQTQAAMYKTPHRGAMILTFGILGMTVCALFAPFAWAMGSSDLKAMKAGRMDESGQGLTLAGMILGMIQSILLIVIIGIYAVLFIVLGIANA